MQTAIDLLGLLFGLTALFGWINVKLLRLPATVGLLIIALAVSLAIIGVSQLMPGWGLEAAARTVLARIDFNETLMKGLLSFLLFAGALHVDMGALLDRRWAILLLATVGVLLSTAIIGIGAWLLLGALGAPIPLIYGLIFGALIAPTDPVAVLAILRHVHVPRSLEAKIAGESLFNDGVGVVIFTILVAVAVGGNAGGAISAKEIALLFLTEAGGGILLGLAAGWLTFLALRSVDDYVLEVIMTLALVTLAYALAGRIHVSGPIAMVIAGLLIGNRGTRLAMSEVTRTHLHDFWRLLDEILNALLFLLIGFEVLALSQNPRFVLYAALMVPLVLAARLVSVALPITLLKLRRSFTRGAIPVLTWGGLRGGISVALALSLPAGPWKSGLLTMCYGIVIFSVVVQGLTIERVIRRVVREDAVARRTDDDNDDGEP